MVSGAFRWFLRNLRSVPGNFRGVPGVLGGFRVLPGNPVNKGGVLGIKSLPLQVFHILGALSPFVKIKKNPAFATFSMHNLLLGNFLGIPEVFKGFQGHYRGMQWCSRRFKGIKAAFHGILATFHSVSELFQGFQERTCRLQ